MSAIANYVSGVLCSVKCLQQLHLQGIIPFYIYASVYFFNLQLTVVFQSDTLLHSQFSSGQS